jgi:hypothetical protein
MAMLVYQRVLFFLVPIGDCRYISVQKPFSSKEPVTRCSCWRLGRFCCPWSFHVAQNSLTQN